MDQIEQKIQEINNQILEAVKENNLSKLSKTTTSIKILIKELMNYVNENLSDLTDIPDEYNFVSNIGYIFQELEKSLQEILSFIENQKFSEQNLEELKILENELQQIIDSIDTIVEILESEEEDLPVGVEKEFEKIENFSQEEDQEEDQEEENYLQEIETTGDPELDNILLAINQSIESEDDEVLTQNLDSLLNYINSSENPQDQNLESN